jgi:hypothetical protein
MYRGCGLLLSENFNDLRKNTHLEEKSIFKNKNFQFGDIEVGFSSEFLWQRWPY